MKILVTGGAGYIGSTLVPMLLKEGHEVTVLDMFVHETQSLAAVCQNSRLNIVFGDSRDKDVVGVLLRGADAIIPLAGVVGVAACNRDQIAAYTTNYEAIHLLTELLAEDQLVVFPATNSGYGTVSQGWCTEASPLNPLSHYGRTKVSAEKVILNEHKNTVSLRFATVFGMSPRMRWDLLVNTFSLRAAMKEPIVLYEPHFIRNYIHVRDAARAIVFALDTLKRGEIYNCGNTVANMSKQQLCELIQQIEPSLSWNIMLFKEDQDKRNYLVNNEKLERTGWTAQHSLIDGIKELIKGAQMMMFQKQ